MAECSNRSGILFTSSLLLCASVTSDLGHVAFRVSIIIVLTKLAHLQCSKY